MRSIARPVHFAELPGFAPSFLWVPVRLWRMLQTSPSWASSCSRSHGGRIRALRKWGRRNQNPHERSQVSLWNPQDLDLPKSSLLPFPGWSCLSPVQRLWCSAAFLAHWSPCHLEKHRACLAVNELIAPTAPVLVLRDPRGFQRTSLESEKSVKQGCGDYSDHIQGRRCFWSRREDTH